jgi:hypothetical protein
MGANFQLQHTQNSQIVVHFFTVPAAFTGFGVYF